jgi:hypothetical protein
VDRLALPGDVGRQTHIDRKQACHTRLYTGTAAPAAKAAVSTASWWQMT